MRIRKTSIGMIAMGACLLAAPSLAGAADITVNDDTTGPGPAGATCATPDQATITGAITSAAAAGDRILVCAGTYTQSQVLIDKSVDLIGAGVGQSIIDGGNATNLPSGGAVRTSSAATGDILVQDFTIRNAGSQNPGGTRYSILMKGNTFGLSQDFNRVAIEGRGAGGTDYGIDADNVDADVTYRNGSITNTDFNPVLLEQGNGAQTLRDTVVSQNGATSTSAIFVVNYSGDNTTNPLRIVGNTVDANGRGGISIQTGFPAAGIPAPATRNSVEVSDNTITDFSGFGLSVLNNDPAANGLAGEISNVGIDGNEINPRTGAATSTGVRVQGLVSNVGINRNNLSGLATNGIAVNNATAGHGPVAVDAHFNRIISTAGGLTSGAAEQVSADRNWWGCNEGPTNTADCSDVTGNVDFDPWLVLGLTASPTSIAAAGGSSNLTADLTTDSNGDVAGPGFPDGTAVAFGTTLGSVGTPRNTADGVAESVLTAGADAGTATVNADLDGESVTTPVTITGGTTPPPSFDAPPVISFTFPETIKAGKRGLLTATASDDLGIRSVDFFVGSKNICQVLTPPYECRFRPRRGKGRIGISAIATDTVGQTAVALGTTRVVKKPKKKLVK